MLWEMPQTIVERLADRERPERQRMGLGVVAQKPRDGPHVVEHGGAAASIAKLFEGDETPLVIIERRGVVADGAIHRAHVVEPHRGALPVTQRVPQLETPQVKGARFVVTGLHVAHAAQLTERERHSALVANLLADREALPQERLGTIALATRAKHHPGPADRRGEPLPIRQARRHLAGALEHHLRPRKVARRIELMTAIDQAAGQRGGIRLRRRAASLGEHDALGCGRGTGGLWPRVRGAGKRTDEQKGEVITRAFHPHPN